MKARQFIILIVTAAVLCTSLPATAAAGYSFKDISGHWSAQTVEKSCTLDLLKGYPDGSFMPESPISRLEAIAIIIRIMGLESEALKVDYKNSGVSLPSGMTWGQGHLVMAVEKKLLNKNYVQQLLYKDPITRAEVATLVAVALDIKGDAGKLAYSDTARIPDMYRTYVAAVTERNIMQGIGDNQFGPDQIMKRGQMAALMARLIDDGWFSYGAGRIITGEFSGLVSASEILVKTADGQMVRKSVDPDVFVVKGGRSVSLLAVDFDDDVRAFLNSAGKVRYLEVTLATITPIPVTPDRELTGKITALDTGANGSMTIRDPARTETSYPLNSNAAITRGTTAASTANLAKNQFVTVGIKDSRISAVKILNAETAGGMVYSVAGSTFTLTQSEGTRLELTLPANIKIPCGPMELAAADLAAGDQVNLVYTDGKILEITVVKHTFEAVVNNVNIIMNIIRVTGSNGTQVSLELDQAAVVRKGGSATSVGALDPGDNVTVTVNGSGKAIQVLTDQIVTVNGFVRDLIMSSSPRIYLTISENDIARYNITGSVELKRLGSPIGPEKIIIGSEARVKLLREELVGIEVTNDQDITVEGYVDSRDLLNNRVTIEQANGNKFTLQVASNCTFMYGITRVSSLSRLSDVSDGWLVRLILTDGRITEFRVLAR